MSLDQGKTDSRQFRAASIGPVHIEPLSPEEGYSSCPQTKEGHLQVKSSFGWVVDRSPFVREKGGQLSVLGVDWNG